MRKYIETFLEFKFFLLEKNSQNQNFKQALALLASLARNYWSYYGVKKISWQHECILRELFSHYKEFNPIVGDNSCEAQIYLITQTAFENAVEEDKFFHSIEDCADAMIHLMDKNFEVRSTNKLFDYITAVAKSMYEQKVLDHRPVN